MLPPLTSAQARILQTMGVTGDISHCSRVGAGGKMPAWVPNALSQQRDPCYCLLPGWSLPLPLPALPVSSHCNLFGARG